MKGARHFPEVELLNWDSHFLGMRVGSVRLASSKDWWSLQLNDWDLVYVEADPDNIELNEFLKNNGLMLADEKTTFAMKTDKISLNRNLSLNIKRYYSSAYDHRVIEVGIQSRIYSRFTFDQNFSREKVEELYQQWMTKSISRDIADEVYVFELCNNEIAGVLTVKGNKSICKIGLMAVDKAYRRQGIGREMVHSIQSYSNQKGYTELHVTTQKRNIEACRFYETCGFKKTNVANLYHFWRRDSSLIK